jgi:tripartite-type tricarboxylate transporter receptor subunit TctC
MQLSRRQFLPLAAGAAILAGVSNLLLTLTSHGAWSQTTRTIKIIVPLPPGSASDIMSRLLAEQINRTQGTTMEIENRPGAGTAVGTEAASRAAPDGNTLLVTGNPFLINPLLQNLNYDPLTSLQPICYLYRSPSVIVVNNASPYRTLANLFDAARAKPGDLTLASIGPGSATQIAFEMLRRQANVDMTFIPFPGIPPAVNALLGEHVTSVFATYGGVVGEQLKAGKLRALATASLTRIKALPDVPTVAESGYKDYEVDIWQGAFAPAKTPKDALSQLAGWFTAASRVPELNAKLEIQVLYPVGMCGSDFASFLRKQYDDYHRAIREANIKAE